MANKYFKIPFEDDAQLQAVGNALTDLNMEFACEADYGWFTVDAGYDSDNETEAQIRKVVKPLRTNVFVYYVDRKIREEFFNSRVT